MKQETFIFIIFLGILSIFSAFCDIDFCLQGEIQTSPWFYEPVFEMDGISFSTAWMAGFKIARFTAGLDIFCEYMNLNGNKESFLFKGAWLDLGCNLTAMYKVTSWLMFRLGAGFLWNQSSFDFNNSGWLGRGLPGIELVFNSMFYLSGFLHLEIINRLDLLLSQNEFMEDIFYTGGARAYIYPGFGPLSFYLEVGASYWDYTSEIMPEGVKSWMFQGQVGLAFDFGKKPARTDHEDNHITDDELRDELANNEENDKEIKYNDPSLETLKNSRAGQSISFYTILFNNEELTDESLSVLDGMAEILIKNTTLIISIRGYSEFMKDPQRELELCKIRTKRIFNYLVARGVKDTQVRQNPVGNIIIDEKRYIIVDVIQNDESND